MTTIGDRLKEERTRLGLSQEAMAKIAGVHRNTQIKYESGKRLPDSDYLDLVQRAGVDVSYLFCGMTEETKLMYDIAQVELGKGIYEALGLKEHEIKEAALELSEIMGSEFTNGGACDDDKWCRGRRAEFVAELLTRSPVFASQSATGQEVDQALLSTILEGLELAIGNVGTRILPAKKAQAVAMLYRAFKASGKVDPAMIEEAVKLASG